MNFNIVQGLAIVFIFFVTVEVITDTFIIKATKAAKEVIDYAKSK